MSGSSRLASQGQRHPLNEEGAAIRVAGRPHAPEQSGQASHAASGTSGTVTTEVSNREDAERSTPGTRASDPHQVLAQVMQQVHASVRRGLSEVWVRLEPPSLGLVEVRLVAFDGMLRVTLASTDPMVRELLQSGSEELRRDLAVRGFRVERVLVTEPLTTSDWGGNAGTATGQEGGWGQQSSRQPGSGVPARALVQPAVQPQQDPVVVPGKRPRGAPESRIEVWA
jgi:flagellar hook-length control protein FliK